MTQLARVEPRVYFRKVVLADVDVDGARADDLVLSEDQQFALDRVCEWMDVEVGRRRQKTARFVLAGLAGTGKTTLVREVLRHAPANTVVCALAGKAAHVLRTKGVPQAQTLHSLLYTPKGKRQRGPMGGGELKWLRRYEIEADFIVVDEASMLSAKLVRDLEMHKRPVLYVGDHGQLEPIGDDPGLMRRPNVKLERVHRQCADSPILKLAAHVRAGGFVQRFPDAPVQSGWTPELADYDVIVCGYNATRVKLNAKVREHRGYEGRIPQLGERVICLRNHADYGVFNGMLGTVTGIRPDKITVEDDAGNVYKHMHYDPRQFGSKSTLDTESVTLWDFGYALTAHKAQGSEWDRVVVVEEIAPQWSAERWRYTAITRAAKEVLIVLRL